MKKFSLLFVLSALIVLSGSSFILFDTDEFNASETNQLSVLQDDDNSDNYLKN